MTKTDFKLMQKICKDCWEYLAETGNDHKPSAMDVFWGACPACEIDRGLQCGCLHCPVPKLKENCCRKYFLWERTSDMRAGIWERRHIAKEIASYDWQWQENYKEVKLSKHIKQFLKDYKANKITFKEN